jgi:hypothetical protein
MLFGFKLKKLLTVFRKKFEKKLKKLEKEFDRKVCISKINIFIYFGHYNVTRVSRVANYSMNSVYIDINGVPVKIVHETQALPIKNFGNPSIVVDPRKGLTQVRSFLAK